LPLDETPQFIVFTHDDATADLSTSLMNEAIGNNKNPNGCDIPVTYFTMQAYSDCEKIKEAWQAGDEIATHTLTHQAMDTKFPNTAEEIIGQRKWLIEECGLPSQDVVGHRSPYLVNNPQHREALVKGGFLYDSTINEHWPDSRMPNSEPDTVSPNGQSRLWPYTMDNGIPQNCAWTGNMCTPDEKYKGLWEVPVWNIQTDFYPDNAYAMDPCDAAKMKCDALELLKSNFDLAYTGNKAPVPIYVHSPWLQQPGNMKKVQAFITWARESHPNDTYFVTMHQLVQWLQNPVPLSQMNDWLGCVPGGNAAGAVGKSASIPVAPLPAVAAPEILQAAVTQSVPTPAQDIIPSVAVAVPVTAPSIPASIQRAVVPTQQPVLPPVAVTGKPTSGSSASSIISALVVGSILSYLL
jgi:peptidoglycan/xylan/chitin deacetylase (PgdA/CDA1 family)